MKPDRFFFVVAALATALLGAGAPAAGADEIRGWLNWRGPQQNGTSLETGLPDAWEVGGGNHLWDIALSGRGTPVITGGRVYSWGYRGEGFDLHEVLVCLDARTGKTIWEHVFNDFLSDLIYDRYTIGAPVIDAETGRLYLMTSPGELHCFTLDGKVLWQRSLMEEFGRNTYPNGRTGTPCIEGHLVIVRGVSNNWGAQGPPRDRFYAFDKRTGQPVWASTPGVGPPFLKDSCFGTPVYAWWEGRRVFYAGLGSGAIVCVNAWTGEPIWRSQQIVGGINSSPVLHDGKLIAVHGRQNLDTTETGRLLALRIPSADRLASGKAPFLLEKKDEVWRCGLSMFTSSPVLVGDRLYQVVHTGDLHCVDVTSGKSLWHKKLAPMQIHASPLWADGKLYVPMNNGSFWILKPSDTGAEVLAQVQLEGNGLGSPAAWNGKVYVHTTGRLYCFGSPEDNTKNLPAPPAPITYPKPGAAVRLQIVPNEVWLRPGEKVPFTAYAIDASGQRAGVVTEPLTWTRGKGKLDAAFNERGELVAASDARLSAGAWKATAGKLSGTIRGRVVARLPYKQDFESFDLTVTHKTDKIRFAHPPPQWIVARAKWEVREHDGSKVLAKTTDRLILHRAMSFIGHPDEAGYTVAADVKTDGNRRGMGEVGVINQRYIIKLLGNKRTIEVNSNIERFQASAPFRTRPGTWYRLKTRVDVASDGSGVIRAKAWKRGDPEPEAWTLEASHARAHPKGAPGLFGFSAQRRHRVYIDNIEITPNP